MKEEEKYIKSMLQSNGQLCVLQEDPPLGCWTSECRIFQLRFNQNSRNKIYLPILRENGGACFPAAPHL